MPCTPAKARKLLRDGRARVIKRCPFTIQLLWTREGHVQEVALGIDKGSRISMRPLGIWLDFRRCLAMKRLHYGKLVMGG